MCVCVWGKRPIKIKRADFLETLMCQVFSIFLSKKFRISHDIMHVLRRAEREKEQKCESYWLPKGSRRRKQEKERE